MYEIVGDNILILKFIILKWILVNEYIDCKVLVCGGIKIFCCGYEEIWLFCVKIR